MKKKKKVKKKKPSKKIKVKKKKLSKKNKRIKIKKNKRRLKKSKKSKTRKGNITFKRKIKPLKKSSRETIIKILRFTDKFKFRKNVFSTIDSGLQNFFKGISDKIENIKKIIEDEKERKRQLKIKKMKDEKLEDVKRSKLAGLMALKNKEQELREELKLNKERKKELKKFIRLEQAEVRREQAEKQRKFLEQIKLEKRIVQFRKREALEIKSLEKFVLSQERESYEEVQVRIDKIREKYQKLRDQKIRERVEQLGVEVNESDDRQALLEKEKKYNEERQKIEFALESFYRSAHSLCFQINKRYIPKYLSIMRVIDRRFETGEIFIKWDDHPDEDWLLLIYIKNNSPDEGIIIEDKTDPEKNTSNEFQTNEIFKASDLMVDSLTKLLDREREKRKNN